MSASAERRRVMIRESIFSALLCCFALFAYANQCPFPARAFHHNGKGGCILDITKPPFNAKGDGKTDDTAALCAAMRFIRDHLNVYRRGEEVHCAQTREGNWAIYIPDGVYRVTGTLSQGWPALGMTQRRGWTKCDYFDIASPEEERALRAKKDNSLYAEPAWQIRIYGQSKDRTIIRLDDGAAGFGDAENPRPLIAYRLLSIGSNINLGHFLENVTLDTGKRNPGVIGVDWSCSNYGAIRNTRIVSPDGRGHTAILAITRNACSEMHGLEFEGFRTGIRLAARSESVIALADSSVKGAETAFDVGGEGLGGWGSGTDILTLAGVTNDSGVRVKTRSWDAMVYEEPDDAAVFPRTDTVYPESDTAAVEDFGAVGDGKTDDTEAVRRAMASGRGAVVFTRCIYRLDGVIEVPRTVKMIDFLHANIVITKARKEALFAIREAGDTLVAKRFWFIGGTMFDHFAARPLVIEDGFCEFPHVHELYRVGKNNSIPVNAAPESGYWKIYRNADPSVRKRLWVRNTISPVADEPLVNVDFEGRLVDTEHLPEFCWAFENCRVRILGEKSENTPEFLRAKKSDIVFHGASFLNWDDKVRRKEVPAVTLEDSTADISVGFWLRHLYGSIVREIRGSVTNEHAAAEFPVTNDLMKVEVKHVRSAERDISWMKGDFGFSLHWTAALDCEDGRHLSFEEAVNGFDAKGVVDTLAKMGAKHLIFTTAHAWQYLPGPNAALDRIESGRTTKRDLFGEILDECAKRGIRVIAYYNHSCNGWGPEELKWMKACACPHIQGGGGDETLFASNICAIVRDMSSRYGRKISGWWFDSAYAVDTRGPLIIMPGYGWINRWRGDSYPGKAYHFPWEELAAAARSGNPDAAVAVNAGVKFAYQYCSTADYYAGESVRFNEVFDIPEGSTMQDSRWITIDDNQWTFSPKRGFLPLREPVEKLRAYIKEHCDAGRMVTFNILIDQRGKINPNVIKAFTR